MALRLASPVAQFPKVLLHHLQNPLQKIDVYSRIQLREEKKLALSYLLLYQLIIKILGRTKSAVKRPIKRLYLEVGCDEKDGSPC